MRRRVGDRAVIRVSPTITVGSPATEAIRATNRPVCSHGNMVLAFPLLSVRCRATIRQLHHLYDRLGSIQLNSHLVTQFTHHHQAASWIGYRVICRKVYVWNASTLHCGHCCFQSKVRLYFPIYILVHLTHANNCLGLRFLLDTLRVPHRSSAVKLLQQAAASTILAR